MFQDDVARNSFSSNKKYFIQHKPGSLFTALKKQPLTGKFNISTEKEDEIQIPQNLRDRPKTIKIFTIKFKKFTRQ